MSVAFDESLIMTKDQAKIAETTTTPVFNIVNKCEAVDKADFLAQTVKMHDWEYSNTGLVTTKQRKDHISSKFGKPLYHANYEYREAIWGLNIYNVEVIMYYSTKGFSIQVSRDADPKAAIKIMKYIRSKLE